MSLSFLSFSLFAFSPPCTTGHSIFLFRFSVFLLYIFTKLFMNGRVWYGSSIKPFPVLSCSYFPWSIGKLMSRLLLSLTSIVVVWCSDTETECVFVCLCACSVVSSSSSFGDLQFPWVVSLITHNVIIQINVLISGDWTHWVLLWHSFDECFIRAVRLIATWLSALYYYPRGKSNIFFDKGQHVSSIMVK